MAAVDFQQLRTFAKNYRLPEDIPSWSRGELSGRLVELSSGIGATAGLTAVAWLLRGSQAAGEPCAWVGDRRSVFFPPDLARSGVDLDALAVVFVRSSVEAGRGAARLLRSGAFGLVVLDLGGEETLSASVEGRLSGLAREHDAAVVLLTDKEASRPSAGSMVSMRVEARRARVGDSRFSVRLEALKDKRRGPGWSVQEVVGGPAGLR